MRRPSYLPNLLSSLRIVLAPAMLGAAYSNAKIGFSALLAGVLVTDALDGAIARRWKLESELGRRLDRWGDGLTMVLGAIGLFLLWPQSVEREWPWVLAALCGYGFLGIQRLIVPAAAGGQTRWWCKVLAWIMPLSLIPLIQEWTPWPFRAAAMLQAMVGLGRLVGAWSHRMRQRPEPTPVEPVVEALPQVQGSAKS